MTSATGVPILPRPCSPVEAVQRALGLLAAPSNAATGYQLGTGGYHPVYVAAKLIDVPWTQRTDNEGNVHIGSDCAGFAMCWCYKLPRHRVGFNSGSWASVSDDLNVDSAIEDSDHDRELFVPVVDRPLPGDLIVYPTIRLSGHPLPWIGHVGIVTGVSRVSSWDPAKPRYDLLDLAQCCGGNGRMPAVLKTDGSHWMAHDHDWPRQEHRSRLLRLVP